jgi:hypothetical protein
MWCIPVSKMTRPYRRNARKAQEPEHRHSPWQPHNRSPEAYGLINEALEVLNEQERSATNYEGPHFYRAVPASNPFRSQQTRDETEDIAELFEEECNKLDSLDSRLYVEEQPRQCAFDYLPSKIRRIGETLPGGYESKQLAEDIAEMLYK